MYIQYSISILLETSSSCHLVAQCEFSQETNRCHMCRSHLAFGEIWLEEDQDTLVIISFRREKTPACRWKAVWEALILLYMIPYVLLLSWLVWILPDWTDKVKEMHEKCLIQQTVSIVIICAIITQIHESNKNKSGIGPHCCPLLVQIWYWWWKIYTEVNLKCRQILQLAKILRSIKKL